MNDCLECGHPLRSTLTPAEDAPGTRQVHGRGLDRSCFVKLERAGVLDKLYPIRTNEYGQRIRRLIYDPNTVHECDTCKQLMRPYGSKAADWPGTVCRKGKSCAGCASKRSPGAKPAPLTTADVRKMRDDLKDWFESRGRDWRLAGIPA